MNDGWTPQRLFEEFFRAAYPQDLRDDVRALIAARSVDENPARNPHIIAQLEEVADVFARVAPTTLAAPDLALDRTDASVHRLSSAIDRRARDLLIESGALTNVVIHGAVYIASCIVRNHGGAYGVRRPLWETVVTLSSRAGVGDLSPFAWWLKALADHEIDRNGLSTRYRLHVEDVTARPEELPPIVARELDRRLPTLKHVRYDTLHKYLVAHLPEVRDLGRDFPSPEQLEEIGFLGLDFLLLAKGRLLLMHGRGRAGLHLIWLDHEGFSHARFFPADPAAPHAVVVDGEKLRIAFELQGKPVVHELLFFG